MWSLAIACYAVFVAVLVTACVRVALSNDDAQRRADAYRVLKLIWGTTTGAGGLQVLILQLHRLGLL